MSLDFKKEPKFTLSASEVRTYCSCPRKHYYSSRDCLAIRPFRTSHNLSLGKKFHASLEFYYTEGQQIIKDNDNVLSEDVKELINNLDFQKYLNDFADLEVLDLEDLEPNDQKTLENIMLCYKPNIIEDLEKYEVIGCEVPFNLNNWPVDDVRSHGFIDMVVKDKKTEKIYFFEHKTCAGFRPDIYSRFDIQLHIYAHYGVLKYGDEFGGMILNEIKKAKTPRGYDHKRTVYEYNSKEDECFIKWLTKKVFGIVGSNNVHEPCNDYFTCKMCEYAPICMKYGYEIPLEGKEILDNPDFVEEDGTPLFAYDPRKQDDDNEQ